MKIKSELKLLHSKDLKMKKATKFLKPLDKNLEWFDFTCQFSKIEEFGLIPFFSYQSVSVIYFWRNVFPMGTANLRKEIYFSAQKLITK